MMRGRPLSKGIFYLERTDDVTGVSGVGRVAQGIQFDNGKVAMTWLSEYSSVAVYDSMHLVEQIHGHDGKTTIMWEDR